MKHGEKNGWKNNQRFLWIQEKLTCVQLEIQKNKESTDNSPQISKFDHNYKSRDLRMLTNHCEDKNKVTKTHHDQFTKNL